MLTNYHYHYCLCKYTTFELSFRLLLTILVVNVAAMNGYTDCARALIQTFRNGQHDAVDCIDDLERSTFYLLKHFLPVA